MNVVRVTGIKEKKLRSRVLHDTKQKHNHLCIRHHRHHLNMGAQHLKIEIEMNEQTTKTAGKNSVGSETKNGNLTIEFSICCTPPSFHSFSLTLSPLHFHCFCRMSRCNKKLGCAKRKYYFAFESTHNNNSIL